MQLEKFNIGFQYRWLLPLLEKLFLNSCHNNIPTNWVSWNRKLGKISPMGDASSNKDRAMVITLTPALPKTKQKGYSVTMCCNSVFWHMCKLCVPAYNTWHASGKGKKINEVYLKPKSFYALDGIGRCRTPVRFLLCTHWEDALSDHCDGKSNILQPLSKQEARFSTADTYLRRHFHSQWGISSLFLLSI